MTPALIALTRRYNLLMRLAPQRLRPHLWARYTREMRNAVLRR